MAYEKRNDQEIYGHYCQSLKHRLGLVATPLTYAQFKKYVKPVRDGLISIKQIPAIVMGEEINV